MAKTNRSALSGSLIFAVEAGTTAAGKIIIDYGIPIEDSGTVFDYPLAAIEETDLASGILTVKIPQGVGARDPITLGGVRFDMAAADVERVVANLRVAPGSGFVIRENYLSVEVISRVLPGLEVDLESDLVFILPASFFRPASLTLAIKEGFSTAFSGNTEFNQNVSTRVQIQIEGLPEGVSVTFPESVATSASDATFTVLGGSETALPTEDGDRSITYEFQKGRTSDIRVETFKFDYTVEVVTPDVESTDDSPPPEKGPVVAEPTAVFLQATLAPGESEECRGAPCVPRYQTEFRPPEDELPLPEFETYFPVSPRLGTLQLRFTNRRDLDLSVRLEALSQAGRLVSGTDIVNPASVTVDRGDQVSVAVEEIFGSGILDVEIGTIAALTRRAEIGAIFLFGDDLTFGDGGAASQPPRNRFLAPEHLPGGRGAFHGRALFQSIGRSRHRDPGIPLWRCRRDGGLDRPIPGAAGNDFRECRDLLCRRSGGLSGWVHPGRCEPVRGWWRFRRSETKRRSITLRGRRLLCGSRLMESPTSVSGPVLRQNSTSSTATNRGTQSFASRFSTIGARPLLPRWILF